MLLARPVVDVVKDDEAFARVNTRRELETRVQVDAIQVDAELIGAVVAARYSVRIQHGYEFEDEVFAQSFGARVILPEYELEEAVEYEGGRRLARMHATCQYEHALLVKTVAAFVVLAVHGKQIVGVEARLASECCKHAIDEEKKQI